MAEMKHPLLGSVVSVREDAVDRYTAAGYEPVKSKTETSTEAPKRSTRKSTKK